MSELLNIGKSGQTTLILDFVKNFPLPNLEFPGMLKRATSTLKLCSENIRNLDDEGSLILPTNIPISFKFNIEIKYAQNVNPSAIKIKAKFTDNSILLFKVPPSDIYIIDSFTYKITSTIRITLPAADGFYLEFSVINTFIPDFLHDFTILNFKNFEKSDIVCMDSEQLVGTEEKTGLIWSEIPSEGSSFLKVHPKKTF
ncbi:hypothetical protein HDU92_004371 [Lobulomyces angularis]|nr:hypothetical protein HDU92_004371 [Lobulomyces angularis]